MKKMKAIVGIIAVVVFFSTLPAGDFRLAIVGGAGYMLDQGAESDYVMEENDFPVIPAFASYDIGLRLGYRFSDKLGMELAVSYFGSATVDLTDPSDNDTVSVDAVKHLAFTLSVNYFFSTGKWQPYLQVGTGVDNIQGEEKKYTSSLGYQVEWDGPDQNLVPLFQLSGGFLYELSPKLDLRVELGYNLIFADPHDYNLITLLAGISLKL
jgi:opacity protein-like surface antigen